MHRWRYCFSILLFLALGAAVGKDARAAERQVLIVANPSLAVDRIDQEGLMRIYLLRQTVWPDGSPIIALNREPGSAARALFTAAVLRQSADALATHWQQMHFKGKTPPLVHESDEAILAFVRKVPGAIGYVDADARIGGDVKILGRQP
ncbi:MAG: hypothetical protein ACU837_09565 [Gammaproteobacteria bacterium]